MSVSFRYAILLVLQRQLADERNEDNGIVFESVHVSERLDQWNPNEGTVLVFGDDGNRIPVLGGQTQALLVNRNPSSRFVDGLDAGPVDSRTGQVEWPLRFDWYVDSSEKSYDTLWRLQRFMSMTRAARNDEDGILGFGRRVPCINGLEFSRGVIPPREPDHAGWTGWLNVVLTLVEDFTTPYPR